MNLTNHSFTDSLLSWYDQHGRKHLPWQHPQTDYHVWLSEIMLQQTQVKTVIPYFLRFIDRFPTLTSLAKASLDEVFAHWSGLGYYRRARHLHAAACLVKEKHHGSFPKTLNELQQLPGIGRSTAAAIASLAFNRPTAIMDGNVTRVLSRYFLIDGQPNSTEVKRQLWIQAQACMSPIRCREYTQAIMDMGATCCTRLNPTCNTCPLRPGCGAYREQRVSELPQKKIKKIRPIREEQWLILHTAQPLIYLQQQPAEGIWGGLWCLPRLDEELNLLNHIRTVSDKHTEKPRLLTHFTHTLTHLQFKIKVFSSATTQSYDSGQWFAAHQLREIGLAKPVRFALDYFLKHVS